MYDAIIVVRRLGLIIGLLQDLLLILSGLLFKPKLLPDKLIDATVVFYVPILSVVTFFYDFIRLII